MSKKTKRIAYGVQVFIIVVAVIGVLFGAYRYLERKKDHATPVAKATQEAFSKEPATSVGTKKASEPTEEESTQEEATTPFIDIVAVGDNLIHYSIALSGKKDDGKWDYSQLYSPMKSIIQEADIAIINQEVPMAGEEFGIQKYPRFNVPQEMVKDIVALGFDVATFATNHMLDQGRQGLLNTLNYWNEAYPDILTTGAYTSKEKRDEIPYKTVKGKKIAFLNYTYGTNQGGINNDTYLLNFMKEELLRADVARAKEMCDFVIVCMHWGRDGAMAFDEQQREYARICADAGVDVVIGTHPHIVHNVEVVTAESGYRTLVYYSLGNFVSLQDRPERMIAGIAKLRLEIVKEGMVEKLVINEYSMDYAIMHYEYNAEIPAYYEMTVYPYETYTEELARKHGLHNLGSHFSMEFIQSFVQSLGETSGNWR